VVPVPATVTPSSVAPRVLSTSSALPPAIVSLSLVIEAPSSSVRIEPLVAPTLMMLVASVPEIAVPFTVSPSSVSVVPDAIVTNGAGNFSAWVHRFWRWREYPTQLAPTSGAMGYGLPAAVAAKALAPHRTVICFAGDGDFLMSGQELATAAQYNLPIVVLVVNNGMYGTIRMHQERHYPGRVVGTELANPDFAAYARAFGAHGETVTQTSEFAAALDRSLAASTSALIELQIDPDAITPWTTLSAIRANALT